MSESRRPKAGKTADKLTKPSGLKSASGPESVIQHRKKNLEQRSYIIGVCLKLLAFAAAVWILLSFIFGMTRVTGMDMYPRISDGDLLIWYRLEREWYVGDTVVFKNESGTHVARIVATGGDTVDFSDSGDLLIDGIVQSENVFYPTYKDDTGVAFPYTVGEDCVFLLSDYRISMNDSRSFGEVRIADIDGKIIGVIRRRNF